MPNGHGQVSVSLKLLLLTFVIVLVSSLAYFTWRQNTISTDDSSLSLNRPSIVTGSCIDPTPSELILISNSIKIYLANNSAIDYAYTLTASKKSGNVARAKIVPTDATKGDTAVAWLRLSGSQWNVFSVGTAFPPPFDSVNYIPACLSLSQ